MEPFIYLIKVNIAIVVLYAFYGLLFRNDTFFQWKRILLLSILMLAVFYPFITVPVQWLSSGALTASDARIFPGYYLNEVVVTANAGQAGGASSLTDYLPVLLPGIYGLGVTILFIRMLTQIASVFFMVARAQKTEINGQTIYRKAGLHTPFSFFRYIVLDPQQLPAHELQEIIRHEETHVRQCHSLDMVCSEAMTVLCWFNPFIWLIRREIRLNLEYLADRSVVNSGLSREHYQFHLLRLTYHKAAATITNNFNVSPLKKRIFMMNKKETPRLGLAKYLLVLPVIAALLSFNICDISTVKAAVPETETLSVTTTETTEDVYEHVEQMPQFPGGDAELMKYLFENISYPEIAVKDSIQGRVVVRFIIRPDGSVDGVQIAKSLDPACDKEAIRVIHEMPKWIPGKQKGKAVSVYYTLPIVFRLQSKSDK